jgi:hypothetical protein
MANLRKKIEVLHQDSVAYVLAPLRQTHIQLALLKVPYDQVVEAMSSVEEELPYPGESSRITANGRFDELWCNESEYARSNLVAAARRIASLHYTDLSGTLHNVTNFITRALATAPEAPPLLSAAQAMREGKSPFLFQPDLPQAAPDLRPAKKPVSR